MDFLVRDCFIINFRVELFYVFEYFIYVDLNGSRVSYKEVMVYLIKIYMLSCLLNVIYLYNWECLVL